MLRRIAAVVALITVAMTTFAGGQAKGEIIENFDDGSLSEYSGAVGFATISGAAAHDGPYGLKGSSLIRRNDAAVHVQQGDTLSVWINPKPTGVGSVNGRAYFGFGSTSSRRYYATLAPNTNQFLLQRDLNDIGASFQTFSDQWYRVEVDWEVGGQMTGRLYDSDGTTLLNTITAFDNSYTDGGIAFRSFGGGSAEYKYFDTVEILGPDTLTSLATGNWNTATTWDDGSLIPSGDYSTVVGNHTVTVAADGAANSLSITNSGDVVIGAGKALTIVNGVEVAPGAFLDVAGTLHADSLTTTGYVQLSHPATLNVPTVDVSGGTLNSSANVTVDNMNVSGGAVHLIDGANLNVATMTVSGGTGNTHAGHVAVSNSLTLGSTAYEISSGHTFRASGSDMLSQVDLAISGGVLRTSTSDGGGGSYVLDPEKTYKVLLVTFSDTPTGDFLDRSEAAIRDRLLARSADPTDATIELTYWPAGFQADKPLPANYETFDLAIATTSAYAANLVKYHRFVAPDGSSVPIIDAHPYAWQQVGLSTWPDFTQGDQITIVDPDHPMAAGLPAGDVQVVDDGNQTLYWPTSLDSDATVIATIGDRADRPAVWVFDEGDQVRDGRVLAAKQIGMFWGYNAIEHFGSAAGGWPLFDAAVNYAMGDPPAPPGIHLPTTSIMVTADRSPTSEVAATVPITLGDLTIGAGVTGLTLSGPSFSFADVAVSDGSSIAGNLAVRGTLSPGGRVGTLDVIGNLTLAAGSSFNADVFGAGADTIEVSGSLAIGANVSLNVMIAGGGKEFRAGTYTLIDALGGTTGAFANVTDLKAYVTVNGNGLTYDDGGLGIVTLTLDKDLNPADANLDGATDVSDRIIWNNNNFTFNTTFATGDWNNDGATDVSDRIIWNNHNFTFATSTPGALGATAAAIPEPATMAMLGLGGLVVALRRRRVRS